MGTWFDVLESNAKQEYPSRTPQDKIKTDLDKF